MSACPREIFNCVRNYLGYYSAFSPVCPEMQLHEMFIHNVSNLKCNLEDEFTTVMYWTADPSGRAV
jgi:hypothetical protein